MKVKDLIKILSEKDPEMNVYHQYWENFQFRDDGYISYDDIETIHEKYIMNYRIIHEQEAKEESMQMSLVFS